MIECVTLDTAHCFRGNPIASQHRLRYRSIIEKQGWDVPSIRGMEYDQYDNPAATYLVWRDEAGEVRGSSRLYPTDRPYMLEEVFPELVTRVDLPHRADVLEGTRFCVDSSLPPELRRRIIQELVLAYLEYGRDHGVQTFLGVMYPVYWRNIFFKSGWDVEFIGELTVLSTKEKVQAGWVHVSPEALRKVRETTGIYAPVLSYGAMDVAVRVAA